MFGVEVIAGAVLPSLVDTAPGYVQDVVTAAVGGTPTGDIGAMQALVHDLGHPAGTQAELGWVAAPRTRGAQTEVADRAWTPHEPGAGTPPRP